MTKDDDGNPVLKRIYLWHVSFWNYFRISDIPPGHMDRCKFRLDFYMNNSTAMGATPVNKTPSANYVEYI
jgi:hypothetical protein